jgi:hypothetical protein
MFRCRRLCLIVILKRMTTRSWIIIYDSDEERRPFILAKTYVSTRPTTSDFRRSHGGAKSSADRRLIFSHKILSDRFGAPIQ